MRKSAKSYKTMRKSAKTYKTHTKSKSNPKIMIQILLGPFRPEL
jgi:hypothetical protein